MAITLSAEGLPAGMSASFAPETLPPGMTRSIMTIVAGPPVEGMVTIRASSNDGQSGVTTQSTARIAIRVSPCPGYAIPDRCPPFPTGGDLAITGVVRERTAEGVRPAEGVSVWAWVQRPTNGYSAGRVTSGPGGEYVFPTLPPSFVVLQAGGGAWVQPCGASVQLAGSGQVMDIEVVSKSRPIFDSSPEAPGITGVVYEQAADGRRPVAGAIVFFETLFEIVAATTTTDEQGRYSLCRLPTTASYITPYLPGYAVTPKPVTVSGVMVMDFELVRQ